MLRTVKTNRVGSLLIPFQYTTTTGTPVAVTASDMYSAFTDNGAGDTTGTLNNAFGRVPVVVATPMSDIDATYGAMAGITSATVTAQRVATQMNDATATDGGVHVLTYGWKEADYERATCPQKVKCLGIRPRIELFTLTGVATIVEGATHAAATAVGSVTTLTFTNAFMAAPTVLGIATTAGNTINVVSTAVDNVVVNQHDSSGSATTGGMHLVVIGYESANSDGKSQRTLKSSQLKLRTIAGRIAISGGTPTITYYDDLGAITDNGVGDYTLTYEKEFTRAPVVIASMSTVGTVAITSNAVTACRLVCQTVAGAAVDPTAVHVMVFGFDYLNQL
jgi:hypothetical protein